MIYFHLFLTYTFISSAIIFYGIEISRTLQINSEKSLNSMLIFKAFTTIIVTTIISFLIIELILIPLNLGELYPLISTLIFLSVSTFLESIVRITTNESHSEFAVSWLIVFLSLTESSTLIEAIVIALSSAFSFFLMLPIVFSLRKRMFDATDYSNEKMNVFLFLSIAVLITVLSAFDVSWISIGRKL